MEHFRTLVDGLDLTDIEILNFLSSKGSYSKFSAQTKKESMETLQMSESKIRKSIIRLEAMKFIDVVVGSREHLIYVTDYGKIAISSIYERGSVE